MLLRSLMFVDLSTAPGTSDRYRFEGWTLFETRDPVGARALLRENQEILVGLIVLDGEYAGKMNTIEELLLLDSCMEWVVVLPAGSLENPSFCELVMNNFFDYHTLPIDSPRLAVMLGHAYGKARLKRRLQLRPQTQGEMIGASVPMQRFYSKLRKIQRSDAPILIRGESGTGKELAARAIHLSSSRSKGPFIAVNCGALPATLIQSELFGHEKGAFTGATHRKIGRLEAASGGTVFLDEIGDLPAELQVNLLRFLQEKTIERIGSTQSIPIDVRIISATHADLERAVQTGAFREDLFYRLNVLTLHLPPLRERGSDIELLARTFLEKFTREGKHRAKGFSRQALEAMLAHSWPGNVRELINRVQKAVILSENRLITVSDLGLDPEWLPQVVSLDRARQRAELETIRQCLAMNNNNVSKAARHLGISRMTMYRLISKLNVQI